MTKESFSFPLLSFAGETKPAQGFLGAIGVSEKYHGTISEEDELIVAIRSKERDERQTQLVLSFTFAWLAGQQKRLGRVIAFAVELPPSVYFISRIGMMDRTTEAVVGGTALVASVAGSFLFLDGVWDLLAGEEQGISPAAWIAADLAVDIPLSIFEKVSEEFGEFGTPIARKDFNPEIVFNFLQLCHLHEFLYVNHKHSCPELVQRLQQKLQQRIFGLFVSISRQSEGLMMSGQSEALAALGGQTAIALGLQQIQSREEILQMIEVGTKSIKDEAAANQILATLASVRENMSIDTRQVQRELDRQLMSSMATEATDLAAQPVRLTLDLLEAMVGGLSHLAPDQASSKLVLLVKSGIAQTSTAVDATPDAISKMLQGGIATESWVRNLISAPWRKAKPGE